MATDLRRIGEKARKEPGLVFTSLYHHICDVDNLRACYDALDAQEGDRGGWRDEGRIRQEPRSESSGPVGAAEADGLSTATEATELHTEAGK